MPPHPLLHLGVNLANEFMPTQYHLHPRLNWRPGGDLESKGCYRSLASDLTPSQAYERPHTYIRI
jgi:hypothetical protein